MTSSHGPESTRTGAESSVFANSGEMGGLCRETDWSRTPLGPVNTWPQSLQTTVALVLGSGFPMIVVWGPELIQIYNDAYVPLIGAKHPAALGVPTHACWPEIRHLQEPIFERVFRGETVNISEAHYPLNRSGEIEHLYFDATFVPVPTETGEVGGSVSTLFDVTSRVTARVLEAEREKFRLLVEHSNDAHALFDSEARLLWANRLMSERLGYTLEELQTLTIPDFSPRFSLARYKKLFERAQRERVPPFEAGHRRKDGTIFPIEVTPTVVELAEGARMFSSVRDITERKQAEAALRESEARFHVLADLSPDAMLVIAEGRYTYANKAAARLLGTRDAQEIVGRSFFDFLNPEEHESVRERAPMLAQNGTVPVVESRIRRLDGSSVDVEVASGAIPWQGMQAVQIVLRDITERKRAEAERERLLHESRQLVAALESSSDFVGLASPEGTGIYVNEAGRRLTGLADMDAVRRAEITDFFFREDVPFVEGTIFPVLERQGRWRGEIRFRHLQTGEAIPVLYDAFRVTDPATGALIGYGTVSRDLTERDRLVREADEARAEAEAANRAKSEFLAVMSHELRTPLNAIGGYAELIEMGIRGPVTEAQRSDLARIQSSQRHLLGLINEVLNYAKLETGSVHYNTETVFVYRTLKDAEALVDPQAHAKGLEIDVGDCPPDVAARADPEKLRQVLVNLLSNAVKFTDRGVVELQCTVEDTYVAVRVRDTGIGIPPEKLDAVFEPFVQVRADLTRTAEGTGLGLAISRDLARGMGGDLVVESTPGEGSTFTLRLPRVVPEAS